MEGRRRLEDAEGRIERYLEDHVWREDPERRERFMARPRIEGGVWHCKYTREFPRE